MSSFDKDSQDLEAVFSIIYLTDSDGNIIDLDRAKKSYLFYTYSYPISEEEQRKKDFLNVAKPIFLKYTGDNLVRIREIAVAIAEKHNLLRAITGIHEIYNEVIFLETHEWIKGDDALGVYVKKKITQDLPLALASEKPNVNAPSPNNANEINWTKLGTIFGVVAIIVSIILFFLQLYYSNR